MERGWYKAQKCFKNFKVLCKAGLLDPTPRKSKQQIVKFVISLFNKKLSIILYLFSFLLTAAVPDLSIPCVGDFNAAQTVPVSSGLTHIAMPHMVNDSTSCYVNMSVPAGHLLQFTVQEYNNSVIIYLCLMHACTIHDTSMVKAAFLF